MRTLILVVVAMLAMGCGGTVPKETADTWSGAGAGAAGAMSASNAPGGSEKTAAGGSGGATVVVVNTASDRYCSELLEYQAAGGFWCELDTSSSAGAGPTGDFVEANDHTDCRWCYLARCGADGFTHWVPVECPGL